VCLDDEASGGCVDPGSEDSRRMRRMEQRKSKQYREQKLHAIQCSANVLRQLGIDSANTSSFCGTVEISADRKFGEARVADFSF
jgi:hypothetical protein